MCALYLSFKRDVANLKGYTATKHPYLRFLALGGILIAEFPRRPCLPGTNSILTLRHQRELFMSEIASIFFSQFATRLENQLCCL